MGGPSGRENRLGGEQTLRFHCRLVVGGLRAVRAVLWARARLDGEERAYLDLAGLVVLAVDASRLKDQLHQRRVVQSADLVAGPIGANVGHGDIVPLQWESAKARLFPGPYPGPKLGAFRETSH